MVLNTSPFWIPQPNIDNDPHDSTLARKYALHDGHDDQHVGTMDEEYLFCDNQSFIKQIGLTQ